MGRESIMMVLLGYFVIAVVAGAAAVGLIGFVVSDLLIGRVRKADRPTKV